MVQGSASAPGRLRLLARQLIPLQSSAHPVYNAEARTVAGGMLLIEFKGGAYSNLAAYFGYTPDRQTILADQNLLFRGFADGAPNIMLVDDPSQLRKRIYIVLLDASPHAAQETGCDVFAEPRIPRPALNNMRDLGGIVVAPAPGGGRRSVRFGQVFRHGRIAAGGVDGDDRGYLRSLGLRMSVDLGGGSGSEDGSVAAQPFDASVETVQVGIEAGSSPARQKLLERLGDGDGAGAAECFVEIYREFVTDRANLEQFKTVVALAMDPSNRPIAFNCSQGRHRTGWVSAVLLLALGADRDAVVADCTASNAKLGALPNGAAGQLAALEGALGAAGTRRAGVDYAAVLPAAVSVQGGYVRAALEAADAEFGGVAGYLEALGISNAARQQFREAMLV